MEPEEAKEHGLKFDPIVINPKELEIEMPKFKDLSGEDLDAVTKDDSFRAATLALLDGEVTVDEWMDDVADAINRLVDIPWIPEAFEQQVFEWGLQLAGKALHGLLRGGSENSPTAG